MLNINELEGKWLHYKVKSYIPHFVITISLLIIVLIYSYIDFSLEHTELDTKSEKVLLDNNITKNKPDPKIILKQTVPVQDINTTLDPLPVVEKKVPVQVLKKAPVAIIPLVLKKDKLLIRPSLDFMRDMKDNSPAYYDSYIEPIQKKVVQSIVKQATKIEEIVLDTKVIEEKEEEIQIKIQRKNTQKDIQHVVKRFKQSNNPALSLFIAKKYYALKNYNQAYNYALITNEINNDIEESWMIFAQALYKLDKRDKAIAVLTKYIASSHSHRAKILLDNIKAGKIK